MSENPVFNWRDLFRHISLYSLISFAPLLFFIGLNRRHASLNKQSLNKQSAVWVGIVLLLFGLLFLNNALIPLLFALLLLAYHRHNRVLFGATLFAMLIFLAFYYYQLHIPLLYKAFLLLANGLLFAALAIYLQRQYRTFSPNVTAETPSAVQVKTGILRPLAALFALLLTLAVSNYSIQKYENILNNGKSVILALAPLDPRSIMQGDYMELSYELIDQVRSALLQEEKLKRQELYALLKQNPDGTTALCRLEVSLPTDYHDCLSDIALPIKIDSYNSWRGIRLLGQQFFFAEGQAAHFEQAKYGEFRVLNGTALLARLLDSEMKGL